MVNRDVKMGFEYEDENGKGITTLKSKGMYDEDFHYEVECKVKFKTIEEAEVLYRMIKGMLKDNKRIWKESND